MARAGVVEVAPGQREQDGEAARGSAGDRNAVTVDQALLHQVPRGVDAVVDVDHAPVSVEPLSICASITRRTAVVHVDQREAAAGPVLVLEWIRRARGAGRPAVAVHHQGWPLARRGLVVL